MQMYTDCDSVSDIIRPIGRQSGVVKQAHVQTQQADTSIPIDIRKLRESVITMEVLI